MKKIKRRYFIQGFVASLLLGLIYSLRKFWTKETTKTFQEIEEESSFASKERLSILQGATSEAETQISICYPKDLKLKVLLRDSKGTAVINSNAEPGESGEHVQFIESLVPEGSHHFLTLIISNLVVHEVYTLIVKNDQGEELDKRRFKTLEVHKNEAACALISCAHDRHKDIQEKMWKAVERAKPDVLFLLGDNVYVDAHESLPTSGIIDVDHIWHRYIQMRNLFYLYKLPFLIPTFAIWDDHDTGTNDSYKDSPLIKEAAEIFDVAFPRHPIEAMLNRTYGTGFHLKLFGLEIMMMDSHSFRTLKNDPKPTHWGENQEKYMEEVLQKTQVPVWIMNGNQFFGAYRKIKESYELVHRDNFNDWFLKKVEASPKPVLLTSGDIHYSEIQRIEPEVVGYPLYEITSSSIHSKIKYLKTEPGVALDLVIESNLENRRLAATGEFNFVLAKIKTSSNEIEVEATSLGLSPTPYFKQKFLVSKDNQI